MANNSGMREITPRRSKTPSLPITSSDSVSEWSKKIREIQKEVDADEEAERKKLEDEIAASRLARASRRSTIITGSGAISGPGGTPANRSELGSALTKLSMSEGPSSTPPSYAGADSDSGMLGLSDELRKLVGRDHINSQGGASVSSPSPAYSTQTQVLQPSTSVSIPSRSDKSYDFNAIRSNVPGSKYTPSKGETMSLAAFMGSTASGPRLNKAPKQEEYNPDLYAPRPDISGPHPIFGRSREPFEKGKPMHAPVPLPGLARKTSPQEVPKPKQVEPGDAWEPKSLEPLSIERKSSDYQNTTEQKGKFPDDQEHQAPKQTIRSPSPIKAQPSASETQPATPVRVATTYDEFGSPTSIRTSIATDKASTSFRAGLSSPPALSRPIQPSPKPPVSPQVAASLRQSPAFLKPPQQKDLTPSLSRLHGRGFVAQRINESEALDSSKDQTGPSPNRKGGVLSRWPPASADSPVRSSPTPESPTRLRALSQIERDREAGIFPGSNAPPPQQQRQQSQPRLGPDAVPLPAMAKTKSPTAPARLSKTPEPDRYSRELPVHPVALPGLATSGVRGPSKSPAPASENATPPVAAEVVSQRTGPGSARTMISYIRPQKTGQSEKSVHQEQDSQPENGVWGGSTSKSIEPASAPVLSHPTRNRPKKPQAMAKRSTDESDQTQISRQDENLEDKIVLAPNSRSQGFEEPESKSEADGSTLTVKGEHPAHPASNSEAEEQARPAAQQPSEVKEVEPNPQDSISSTTHASKRRLSVPKYPASVLPPLVEEPMTLDESHQGTIRPSRLGDVSDSLSAKNLEKELSESSSEGENEAPAPIPASNFTIAREDEPLLLPDISHFLKVSDGPFKPNTSFQPISIEAFALQGLQSLKPLDIKPLIVYETECVAIVYRVKSCTTGLASTKVFSWVGRSWQENAHERRKLNELSNRHSSPLIYCPQGGESDEFLYIVGNTLITREGSRGHWSIENMTMQRVRRLYGTVMIDELPFDVGNLCAGFSYILSMLGTVYVWHGKGSLRSERAAAMGHAQCIKGDSQLVEVRQGKEDETFWMMLGEGFTSADYWRFRDEKHTCDPRFFEVISKDGSLVTLRHHPRFSGLDLKDNIVVLADCFFELFIIIGAQARDNRKVIRSALAFAKTFSGSGPTQRLFTPPIHVIVLPSQLPAELRMALRFVQSDNLSEPQHMNILTLNEAVEQLGTPSWTRTQLADENFLPLGIGPSML